MYNIWLHAFLHVRHFRLYSDKAQSNSSDRRDVGVRHIHMIYAKAYAKMCKADATQQSRSAAQQNAACVSSNKTQRVQCASDELLLVQST